MFAEPQLGWKKSLITFKSFDIEFLPFIQEINAKEGVIRELADAATMERVRSMLTLLFDSLVTHTTTTTARERYNYVGQNLTQAYRNGCCPPGYHVRVKWFVDT